MASPEARSGTMTSSEVRSGIMTSPEVPCEMIASPFETMAAFSTMKLSESIPIEMPELVFASMAEMAFPEMMTPAVFKMAPGGIIGLGKCVYKRIRKT